MCQTSQALKQNLTIQATESNARYFSSTVFNLLESQMECFVARCSVFDS